MNLNMKINQLTCMGPNRMLIESTDANKIISTFILKYADNQTVEPLSRRNVQTNLSLFKVDNLIDDEKTNDAFIRTIQLENIESFKMPDLFKHAFNGTTTGKGLCSFNYLKSSALLSRAGGVIEVVHCLIEITLKSQWFHPFMIC